MAPNKKLLLPTHLIDGIVQFSSNRGTFKFSRATQVLNNKHWESRLKVVDSLIVTQSYYWSISEVRNSYTIHVQINEDFFLFDESQFEKCIQCIISVIAMNFTIRSCSSVSFLILDALEDKWLAQVEKIHIICVDTINDYYIEQMERLFDIASERGAVKRIRFHDNNQKNTITLFGNDGRYVQLTTSREVEFHPDFFRTQLEKLVFAKYPSIVQTDILTQRKRINAVRLFADREHRTYKTRTDTGYSFYITIGEKNVKIARKRGHFYVFSSICLAMIITNILLLCVATPILASLNLIISIPLLIVCLFYLMKECLYLL